MKDTVSTDRERKTIVGCIYSQESVVKTFHSLKVFFKDCSLNAKSKGRLRATIFLISCHSTMVNRWEETNFENFEILV